MCCEISGYADITMKKSFPGPSREINLDAQDKHGVINVYAFQLRWPAFEAAERSRRWAVITQGFDTSEHHRL